ncbi:MAG: glycoside hydrolase family 43 protein [Actinomycetota bacterium]
MSNHAATYTNPIYSRDFPDPFVLRFNGRYYAYATSPVPVTEPGQQVFPMLSSTDLVSWRDEGCALSSLDLSGLDAYWAPEVAYSNGRFYLYYAVGSNADPNHHLRVAVAEHPLGPWRDSGRNLTPDEIFAIDAHPFQDPRDGRWYLFYARDSLTPPYAGTGLAVDELVAMDTLAGSPREVLRPFADWQVFELQRAIKQDLDWYTIEGAFVTTAGGRYVCFYSGGRWENPNYGVSFAVADHPAGPWKEAVGREGPPLLRTVPGRVIGPGHNSVIVGPDLLTEYLVYHGWDPEGSGRYPRIDRLWYEGGAPRCAGPTYTPQPAPPLPDVAVYLDAGIPPQGWTVRGVWSRREGGVASTDAAASLAPDAKYRDFVAEVSVRSLGGYGYGISVGDVRVALTADRVTAGAESAALPTAFRHDVWHRLLLRREVGQLTVTLDSYPTLRARIENNPAPIVLHAGAEFSHLALSNLPAKHAKGNGEFPADHTDGRG